MGGDMQMRESQSHKSRILVVDDDRNVRLLVEHLLSGQGYEVETADSGAAGLAALKAAASNGAAPDLVLLDMTLPDMDGLAFLEARTAVAGPQIADVPVIVLSGRSGNADVVAALTCGASNYVAKPFRHDQLLSHVARMLPQSSDVRAAG
jgi:two-component system, chemotaxis family, chemotaxis protein CheY